MKATISEINVVEDDMKDIYNKFVTIKIDLPDHSNAIEVIGVGYTEACSRAMTIVNAFNN